MIVYKLGIFVSDAKKEFLNNWRTKKLERYWDKQRKVRTLSHILLLSDFYEKFKFLNVIIKCQVNKKLYQLSLLL